MNVIVKQSEQIKFSCGVGLIHVAGSNDATTLAIG
jgi:hypothetical protein